VRSSSVSATRLSRWRPTVATASVLPPDEYVTRQFFSAREPSIATLSHWSAWPTYEIEMSK
jgi:hypothetical protein